MPSLISIFGQMTKSKENGIWILRNRDGVFSVDCREVPQDFAEGDYVHITGCLDGYYSRNLLPAVRIKPVRVEVEQIQSC